MRYEIWVGSIPLVIWNPENGESMFQNYYTARGVQV